jgi:3-hydroxyacyl-CoA dehydrogenase/enoyl-CoA hydratase/3-hydroxybutyryl-CoA epimerase
MPLLEIIKGEKTSEETLYRALDVAKQIKKTPIVVNDSRGFFTSRVIGTFINEGIAMLTRGCSRGVDRAGLQPGRLPGARAAAQRRAEPQPDGEDPQGHKDAIEAEGGTLGRRTRVR